MRLLCAALWLLGVGASSSKRADLNGTAPAVTGRAASERGRDPGVAVGVQVARVSRGARSSAVSADAWLQILTEYARKSSSAKAGGGGGSRDSFPQPFSVDLPLGDLTAGGRGRRGGARGALPSTLPVLVLPLPVPVPSGCEATRDKEKNILDEDEDILQSYRRNGHQGPRGRGSQRQRGPDRTDSRSRRPSVDPWFAEHDSNAPASDEDYEDEYPEVAPARRRRPERPVPSARPVPTTDTTHQPAPALSPLIIVSSQYLVDQFRAQSPRAPHLPPALLGEEVYLKPISVRSLTSPPQPARPQYSWREQPAGPAPANYGREPPRPRFDRSLLISGKLTVPKADYTEPYAVWWDAASGSARVEHHGGTTISFRTMLPDGRVQRIQMAMDRSEEREVRRCATSAPQPAAALDRHHPALPDIDLFSFAGYAEVEGVRAERWQHTVRGRAGELGAATGEELSFYHEMLLTRTAEQTATPYKYTVTVDSSVLGPACDGYEHRYEEVRMQSPQPSALAPSGALDTACDVIEQLDAARPAHLARLDPLREFTLPHRDLRYDVDLEQFKKDFDRHYVDNTEEAVRKNLLIQHSRFVSSGNREGATFEMGVNFLGDRLDVELDRLLGVVEDAEGLAAEQFPHSTGSLNKLAGKLPSEFDWRKRGGVSPVRYQGSCSSCWAFAVASAVEGALFRKTGRLVPLSEQCLVDCAKPFGGNGCGGTWPSHAYEYVRERGLPALQQYTPYAEKVLECRDTSVPAITRISAHVNVTRLSVPALKVAVRRHAPSVVIVDAKAKSFIFYKKGVLYDDRCGKASSQLNHAVLTVGWGERERETHFILKNSWSAAWGEDGYVRVQGQGNTCGVLTSPSYPRLERADVTDADANADSDADESSNESSEDELN